MLAQNLKAQFRKKNKKIKSKSRFDFSTFSSTIFFVVKSIFDRFVNHKFKDAVFELEIMQFSSNQATFLILHYIDDDTIEKKNQRKKSDIKIIDLNYDVFQELIQVQLSNLITTIYLNDHLRIKNEKAWQTHVMLQMNKQVIRFKMKRENERKCSLTCLLRELYIDKRRNRRTQV